MKGVKTKNGKKSTLSKILFRLRGYRGRLLITLLLSVAIVSLTLYVPILIGDAIDLITEPGRVDFKGILAIFGKVCIAVLLTSVFQWVMNAMNNHITFSVTRDMRKEAFSKIQSLPLSYLDRHRTGDIVSRIITDVDQFADGLLMGFTQLFTGVITILGTMVFMLVINWHIALVVLIVTPLSLFIARFIATHTFKMFRMQSEIRGEQTAVIDEYIGQQKVVQAFSHEEKSLEEFDEVNDRLEKCSLKAIFYSSLVAPTTRFVNALVYAGVCIFGAISVIGGGLTVGVLSVFLNYANQYTKPFNEISGVVTELQNALACAGRVFDLLEEPPQPPDPDAPQRLESVRGDVEIRGLKFSYDPEKPIIKGVSISAKRGQRIAIVGPTGCGKTTMINLLMRFYDPDGGSITVDGVDTRNMTRHDLRRMFGMVLQDTWLKSGTIRENITMGKPDATDEEVIAAAKASHAHSFIKKLSDGYDTVIGEAGGMLSQGQKQLLCITRLMLSLPPMLILDEATSSIDTATEADVQSAFAEMMKGRTSFIVAHRLSTIKEADVIIVMRSGEVVETGTHGELLEKGGFYAELYNSQFAH